MIESFTNSLYGYAQQIANGVAPAVSNMAQVAPQFMLTDFKVQKIYFGSMAVLHGSLGLFQSHVIDNVVSCFIDREVKPIRCKLAAHSIMLIAGGAFLFFDALSEFHGLYTSSINHPIAIFQPKEAPATIHGFATKFAEEHKSELEDLCQHKTEIGEWNEFSHGLHKIVYIHPDLPAYLVKIPGVKDPYSVDRLKAHFINAQFAREIVESNNYAHLLIPETHLLETFKCPIVIEEKFEFMPMTKFDRDLPKTVAESELESFISTTGFKDTILGYCGEIDGLKYCGHNARFIKDSEHDPKIAIFDFDTRD